MSWVVWYGGSGWCRCEGGECGEEVDIKEECGEMPRSVGLVELVDWNSRMWNVRVCVDLQHVVGGYFKLPRSILL